MTALFSIPPFTFADWSDGFAHLSRHLTQQPTVILFDEISWMGAKNRTLLKVWWDLQKSSAQKKGCQIDYLIQMRFSTLFVCEIKMRRREIGLEVIDAMKEKIKALSLPKGVGISPVLFHLGPVSDALLRSGYFYRIIDIATLQ